MYTGAPPLYRRGDGSFVAVFGKLLRRSASLLGRKRPSSSPDLPAGTEAVAISDSGLSYDIVVPLERPDPVADEIRKGLPTNRHLLEVIDRFTSSSGRVADFGAHLGSVGLHAAATGRQVLAVDASREFVDLMNLSARRNGFDEFSAAWAAVADRDGTIGFVQNGPFGQVGDGPVQVPMRASAGLIAARGWDSVDVVKVDVEGFEPEALRGMVQLLTGDDAPVIAYESNAPVLSRRGVDVHDLQEQLRGYGYEIYRLEDGWYAPVPSSEPQIEGVVDLVALAGRHVGVVADRLRAPLSDAELADRAFEWSNRGAVSERLHLVSILAGDHPFTALAPARAALRRLAADGDAAVASAAASV